ncbi:MAG: IS110 family transposase [Desulfitobacterium sp.]|nr:IS110 family transposase [Desulfitobacterium sp.]
MKYNQNSKIMQVTESTLIVGVDIAKKVHYARVFDWRGIELDKIKKFESNYIGFLSFKEWLDGIAKKHEKDKVIVGIEPTGHYWYTFAEDVLKEGYMLVQVNPYHVKMSKELDDNSPSKSDRKDPKTIAMLVKDGRYQIPYIPKGIYAELREANNLREEWLKKNNSVKNRIQRWLAIYFPEFGDVFASWEGKTALITLEVLTLPENVCKFSAEDIVLIWREEVKRGVGIKRALKLLEASTHSVGSKEGTDMAVYKIRLLLREYRETKAILHEIEGRLENMVLQIPGAEKLLTIKGIGIKTLAGLLAEIGDINRFSHPKQIIKLAGLNLRENSSGTHKGKTTISKRGRSRLRAILFRAILPLVANNKEFRELHKYYTTRKENPLKKKQSLIALCGKLIRVAYALITKDVEYNSDKMMEDIKRSNVLEVA